MAERLGSAVAVRSIASYGGRESSVGLISPITSPLVDFSSKVRGGDGSEIGTSRLLPFGNLNEKQIYALRKSESKSSQTIAPEPTVSEIQEAAKPPEKTSIPQERGIVNTLLFFPVQFLSKGEEIRNGKKFNQSLSTGKSEVILKLPVRGVGITAAQTEREKAVQVMEQYAMARRLRARASALTRIHRVAGGSVSIQDLQAQAVPELKTEVVEPLKRFESQKQTDGEVKERTQVLTKARRGDISVVRQSGIDESERTLFVGVDNEMNKARVRELKKTLHKLRINGEVKGESLVSNSEIQNSEYKSRVLFQTGDGQKNDGGIRGIINEIRSKNEINPEDIEVSVEKNNALVRSSFRPAKLAELKELVKVYSKDERLPDTPPIPVIEIEKIETVKDDRKQVLDSQPANAVAFAAKNSLESEQVLVNGPVLNDEPSRFVDNLVAFPSRLVDMVVDNIRPSGIDELAERRQLILAA